MSNASIATLTKSEFKKISSTRLWWGLLLGVVVFTALSAGLSAGFAGQAPGPGAPASPGLEQDSAIRTVYASATFGGAYVLALILGITGMTGEYRYQTITPTFLVSPRRSRTVVAKMLAHVVMGLVYGLVSFLAALGVGALVISLRGFDLGFGADRLWSSVALAIVAVSIWTLLGLGIGTLVRNQIVAILLGIFLTFLIEPLLSFALAAGGFSEAVKYLPTNASSALTAPGNAFVDLLDWWQGGLVLLAYAFVLAGAGMLLSVRRDVT